jgi:probable HAF family extracellular repeat protein
MRYYAHNRFVLLVSVFALSSLMATASWSQSLTWYSFPKEYFKSFSASTPDGSVVIGSGDWQTFRWVNGVVENITPLISNIGAVASGISADGSVLVGTIGNYFITWRAFRWTATEGVQFLGSLGGRESVAHDVSADGSVVVGWAYNAAGQQRAFRWTRDGGMQDLGTLPNTRNIVARAVSADGSTVVGAATYGNISRAFRWTASEGLQDLGTLPGDESSTANAVSADGSVVVGLSIFNAFNTSKYRAFRWTASGGMQELGARFVPLSVSADGNIVVGWADPSGVPSEDYAFRWTDGRMEDLNQTYRHLLGPSRLIAAYYISPNGRYIVGTGYNAAARRGAIFVLDTGFPIRGDVDRNGSVDDADLLRVLFAFGGRGYCNEDLNWDGIVDDADLLEVLFHFGSGS